MSDYTDRPYIVFSVRNQTLMRTDTFNVVQSSVAYLKAHFDFLTDDWDETVRHAIFTDSEGNAYTVLLDDKCECNVPVEVLQCKRFSVSPYGLIGTERITTGLSYITCKPTGYAEGETPEEPTPTVYEKLITYFDETKKEVAEDATLAAESANSAAQSETSAVVSERAAEQSASEAADSATKANASADRAEQAAESKGYMYIDGDAATGVLYYYTSDNYTDEVKLQDDGSGNLEVVLE